jgi:hypothetical protein
VVTEHRGGERREPSERGFRFHTYRGRGPPSVSGSERSDKERPGDGVQQSLVPDSRVVWLGDQVSGLHRGRNRARILQRQR